MEGLLTVNNVWMMICTALVFFMHLGFSLLEIGLTRQKNTINVLFKNVFIICVGLLLYALMGFNLMYPGFAEGAAGFFGFAGWGIGLGDMQNSFTNADGSLYADGGYTYWTDFLFQGMFAATAATIVSGAVAERIKLGSFMIFVLIYVGVVYPIAGSWQWGGGFLSSFKIGETEGFYDFAGSTLVHSVGGWAALVAVALLGPRIGKFTKDGKPSAIPGHNIPFAVAGVLILWLGWFGFNGGSVLSADAAGTSITLVTTCLAAAAGGVAAFMLSFIVFKNFDLTMFLNGILAGLVGITAGADQMSPADSIIIGAIAGVIVVLGVMVMDKLKLDDPVGAVAVHLICGVWGTLAVGLFGAKAGMDQFIIQLIGVACYGGFCLVTSFIILFGLKATMGLRVTREEEIDGLDQHEHSMSAYSDFRVNQN